MLKKAFFTNSFFTLFSRVLGYIRDVLSAGILGANIYSDIFFVAFKFPNLFRRIVSEGAFSQSFLPSLFASTKKGVFSSAVFLRFLIIIMTLSIAVNLFSPFFTKLIAFGFSSEEVALAAPYVAINFWYLPLVFVTTFLATLLQYKNRFFALAFFPSLLNVAIIIALLLSIGASKEDIVLNLSFGVVGGGVFQMLFLLYFAKNQGALRMLKVGFLGLKRKNSATKKDLKYFYSRFGASVLGSSTAQISSFLDTFLASFLASGAISYLYYANRVFQLPLAIFALALSTAIFPTIARYIKNKKEDSALLAMKHSFWFLLIVLSTFAIGGITLASEVVELLFQRGAFSLEDTYNTAPILQAYLIGLIPFGLAKVFSLWLYSEGRQLEAAKISAKALLFNIVCSLILILPLGAFGLALAGSLGGVVLFLLTVKSFGLKRFFSIIKDKKIFLFFVIIVVEIYFFTFLEEYLS
ncbi:MAG: murein biosynthesis integral membrane protein MurJ [Campylobacterales bacterium]